MYLVLTKVCILFVLSDISEAFGDLAPPSGLSWVPVEIRCLDSLWGSVSIWRQKGPFLFPKIITVSPTVDSTPLLTEVYSSTRVTSLFTDWPWSHLWSHPLCPCLHLVPLDFPEHTVPLNLPSLILFPRLPSSLPHFSNSWNCIHLFRAN